MVGYNGWKDYEPRVCTWDELYNITFDFEKGSYYSYACQNLMAFDIETSNGWRQPDGSVIGFDHHKYNEEIDGKPNPDFDIEYKNMIDNGEPVSCLYVWQFAIENTDGPMVFMGRTWEDYEDFIDKLTYEIRRQAIYGKSSKYRMSENIAAQEEKVSVSCKVFIHNASFEFQHLRNIWDDEFAGKGRGRKAKHGNVFARNPRKPMKFSVNINRVKIEHRDSYVLTQKSLKAWCEDEKLPVQKLEEPKDYYLVMRTPNTPLTDEEINYSINDVVSMIYGLKKYKDKYAFLNDIPLTQTGAVRAKCKERVCIGNPDWAANCALITRNYTPQDFKNLCQLFQGGWTHANRYYVNKVLKDIKCFDFASSYPAVMTTREFPITQFQRCDVKDFPIFEGQDVHHATHRWYAKIKVYDFDSKLDNTYWSLSKVCVENGRPQIKGQIVDNGRLYEAEEATIFVSDLDWDTFKQAYHIDHYEVVELYAALSGYLPNELILTILEYFQYKTSLKGDESKASLYGESKQFINSIYGCAVTKIVTDLITFNGAGWDVTKFNDDLFYETIQSATADNTFLAYQMGIWVTAWARHNLWDFIIKMDKRIVYCDTDSIKGKFDENDLDFVANYNKGIEELENEVANKLGFSPALYTATTTEGKVKRLGIMEREDDCLEFKTLGAKRYVDKVWSKKKQAYVVECTIAGLPKEAGEKKLKSVEDFKDTTVWNTMESEKVIARYNDDQKPCVWVGRDGIPYKSKDRFGICLQPTTFDLSMSGEFRRFLFMLAQGRIDRNDEFFSDVPNYIYK